MIPDARPTTCPEASRFWEVALGGSWEPAECRHLASCPLCQEAERTVRAAVGDRTPGGRARPAPRPGVRDDSPPPESSLSRLGADSTSVFLSAAVRRAAEARDRFEGAWEPGRAALDTERLGTVGESARQAVLHAVGALGRGSGDGRDEPSGWTETRSPDASVTRSRFDSTDPGGAPDPTQTAPWETCTSSDATGAPPALPQVLGDYRVIGMIGRGGMGCVYKVRDVALERVAALKIGSHAASGRTIDRFYRAARLVARMHHPSIVPIYQVGQVGGMPYVVSEFIEGGDLSARMRAGRLPAREAAGIIFEVAEALQYIHEQGVIHRDVKPSNILIRPGLHAVLTDFGLARSLTADDEAPITSEGQVFGTPAYMSPEQILGRVDAVGPASDIYSLGATFYELLAGQRPHRGGHVFEMLQGVLEDEPVPPRRLVPAVPVDLEAICLKALSKNPDHRYGSARAMADDLRRYLEGRPILTRPLGPRERVARWLRRRPLPAVVALWAVAALALVVFQHAELRREAGERAVEQGRRELRLVVNRASEARLRAAVRVGESRVGGRPESPESRRALASAHHRLGDLLVNTDRLDDAARAYETAIRLLNPTPGVAAGDRSVAAESADLLDKLGVYLGLEGRNRDARRVLSESVRLRRRLVADGPEGAAHRDDLATTAARLNQLLDSIPVGTGRR